MSEPATGLVEHGEPLVVVRLGPGADIPDWASSGTLFSVTATADETSLVCGARGVPRKVRQQGPFLAFSVEGTLDFALTGVLAGLLAPLAEAAIPVFALSTFDTDWLLVPADRAPAAAEAWRRAGRAVRGAHETGPPEVEGAP
jgi:uncharacterized protein